MMHIELTAEETKVFRNAIKRGVYQELYRKNMLTDAQLNELLTRNR